MKKPRNYWTPELVLAEGCKYASRKEFQHGNQTAYKVAQKLTLLDQLYPSKNASYSDWSDDATVLAEGRKYDSRGEFSDKCQGAYRAAGARGLLDQLYPSAVREWTEEAVLAEGRKYSSRGDFAEHNKAAYGAAYRRDLLDQLYPSTLRDWSNDADVLAEGRKYSSRKEFGDKAGGAYNAARERNLLDQLYPKSKFKTGTKWADDAVVLVEGRKYNSRKEFADGSRQAYRAAQRRGLLDQLYDRKIGDWSNDNDVLAEGRKYKSRAEFQRAPSGAYGAALRRNLLDLIDFPENNAPSDNDAIYIWRAVGQHYNGNPVYKIGVTSVRLGTARIEQVAKDSGFEFELICCEAVQCKAHELERKLHVLGEDPQFTGFNGATEFRALSSSALYAAVSLICSST